MLNPQMNCAIKILTAAVCCATANSICSAQIDSCKSRDVPVIVRDSHGVPIDDLLPSDFVAKAKGREIKISSIDSGTPPGRVVMLLDTSGSMNGTTNPGEWKLGLEILNHFASKFSPRGQLALLTFDTTVRQTIDFAEGNDATIAQLKKMRDGEAFSAKEIHGRTALFDAVHKGWQLLENASSADAILVVTDGFDTASKLSPRDLERELLRTGVRFYVALIEDARMSYRVTPEGDQGPPVLKELADTTGGEVFGPAVSQDGKFLYYSPYKYNDEGRIEKALMIFYEGLFHLKVLKLDIVADPSKKAAEIDLKLSKSAQNKWKSATLTYQHVPVCAAKPN